MSDKYHECVKILNTQTPDHKDYQESVIYLLGMCEAVLQGFRAVVVKVDDDPNNMPEVYKVFEYDITESALVEIPHAFNKKPQTWREAKDNAMKFYK